ncbi:MAG: phosphatase PAP2 family protein [Pedosphaera sp.]|nr:phosphatase PAP2 family protein [Pedosphaera sp.]
MTIFQTFDPTVFHWVNQVWTNPVFDLLMPFLSGNRFFVPCAVLLLGLIAWRGGRRARCFLIVLFLSVAIGETIITGPLKKGFGRLRPFLTESEIRLLVGRGPSFAMPSGHAAIWAAAAAVTAWFYRRSPRYMVPLAGAIGYSRMYVGVHWPTDVLAGWLIGTAHGWTFAWLIEGLWRRVGREWFPLWWKKQPSLLYPEAMLSSETVPAEVKNGGQTSGHASRRGLRPRVELEAAGTGRPETCPTSDTTRTAVDGDVCVDTDTHWWRLGCLWVGVLLLARVVYLASGTIELSEDEAYQWLWSKHPALSYYSKPPLIAYTQWLGTHLWGDTELGVRFFSPVIAAVLGTMLFHFVGRWAGFRTGFWFLVIVTATPLLAVGSILMTIDPLMVLFWMVAMLAGWRAIAAEVTGRESPTRWWVVTGVGLGCGFLSKYSSPLGWVAFALFFLWIPSARVCLRRPGLWLALSINLVCTLPVLIWNWQHGAVTLTHLRERSGLTESWMPTLRHFWDFAGAVLILINPVFLLAAVVAAVGVWRTSSWRDSTTLQWEPDSDFPKRGASPLLMKFVFCQGVPLLLFWTVYTLRAQVLPNWISPAVLPLLLLGTFWWHRRWMEGDVRGVRLLIAGIALGLPLVGLLHNTDWVAKLAGSPLPAKVDPLRRVCGFREVARIVGEQRDKLVSEGRATFVIADHYGRTGLLSFYLPGLRRQAQHNPEVYAISSDKPKNQFWFWPGYSQRKGQSAVFMLADSLNPQKVGPAAQARADAALTRLRDEFGSVDLLGPFEATFKGRVFHRFQLFACRDKK